MAAGPKYPGQTVSLFSPLDLFDHPISLMQENIEMAFYCAVSFFLPFLLSQQLILGSLVNAGLVLGALNLRGWKVLPVILLPSLGVLAAGLIFGNYSGHLLPLIPAIWVGNALLVWAVKEFAFARKMHKLAALAIGIVAKTAFIFGATFALVSAGLVPSLFLLPMGALQLYTACAGGILALGLQAVKKRLVA